MSVLNLLFNPLIRMIIFDLLKVMLPESRVSMRKVYFLSLFILLGLKLSLVVGRSALSTTTIRSASAQDEAQSNNTSMELESLTGVPYPIIPHENPDAIEHTKKFSPPTVVNVTDGVYSAIGYGMANIMMIEGTDGIIIVDTGETNEQAEQALSEFRKITDKPVVAVIYTHNHVDHSEGAGVFVKDGESAGRKVDVIGQESLLQIITNHTVHWDLSKLSLVTVGEGRFFQKKEKIEYLTLE
jgi:hypothetical protein